MRTKFLSHWRKLLPLGLALPIAATICSASGATFDFQPKLSYYHHTTADINNLAGIYGVPLSEFDYDYGKTPFRTSMVIKVAGSGVDVPGVVAGDYIHIKASGTISQNGGADQRFKAAAVLTTKRKILEWRGRGNRFQQVAPTDADQPGKVIRVASVPTNKPTHGFYSLYHDGKNGTLGETVLQDPIRDFSLGWSDGPGVIIRVPTNSETGNVWLWRSVDSSNFSQNTNGADTDLIINEVDAVTGRPKIYLGSGTSITINENANGIHVYRDNAAQFTTRVNYTLNLHDTGDFSSIPATSGTLQFDGGSAGDLHTAPSRRQTIPLTVNDDNIYEGTESFTVTLSVSTSDNPNEAYVHSSTQTSQTYTVNISDNDPLPTVTFSSPANPTEAAGYASSAVNEPAPGGSTTVNLPIRLSNPSKNNITIWYAEDAGVGALTNPPSQRALGGSDFVNFPTSNRYVTVPAGQVTANIPVTVIGDGLFEGPEKLMVGLGVSAAQGNYQNTKPGGRHVLLINDHEVAPVVNFAAPTTDSSEDTLQIPVAVTLNETYSVPVTVTLGYGGTSRRYTQSPAATPAPSVDALYIDGPLGRKVMPLTPSQTGLAQWQYSEMARDFALSPDGWNLGALQHTSNELGSPDWFSIDNSSLFDLRVILTDPNDRQTWGYELNQQAIDHGSEHILLFHTDAHLIRGAHNIGEISDFGVISGLMSGSFMQLGVKDWGRYGLTKSVVPSTDPDTDEQYLYIDSPLGFKYRALLPEEQGLIQENYSILAREFAVSDDGWKLAPAVLPLPTYHHFLSPPSFTSTDGTGMAFLQVADTLSNSWGYPSGTHGGNVYRSLLFQTDTVFSRGTEDWGEPAPFGVIAGCAYLGSWQCPSPTWGTYGILDEKPQVTPYDFTGPSSITIPANHPAGTPYTFNLTLNDDAFSEAPESIIVNILSVENGNPGSDDSHIVTVVDNDVPKWAETTEPDPGTSKPAVSGTTLEVHTTLPDPDGGPAYTPVSTFRVRGEPVWRMPGTTVAGLSEGIHVIEFRPIKGFLAPRPRAIEVRPDGTGTLMIHPLGDPSPLAGPLDGNVYTRTDNFAPGSLTASVQVGPPPPGGSFPSPLPGWQLEGETGWRPSGDMVADLPAGPHRIVYQSTEGYVTPAATTVSIPVGGQATIPAAYYFNEALSDGDSPPSRPELMDLADTDLSPAVYCGLLETSSGFASGVAVLDKFVITTAHALFDAENLVYVTDVRWYHQRQQDEFVPGFENTGVTGESHRAQTWHVLGGYAAARQNGVGQSSPQAQILDVGVVSFDSVVARGGKIGLMESTQGSSADQNISDWLDPSFLKTLIGYPTENVPYENRGKMHASTAAAIGDFRPITPSEYDVEVTYNNAEGTRTLLPLGNPGAPQFQFATYRTPELLSTGGMSGGGLFVDPDTDNNGTAEDWRLAAIYLGENGYSGIFRVIDGTVIDLINSIKEASDDSTFRDEGTPPPDYQPGAPISNSVTYNLRIHIQGISPSDQQSGLEALWREVDEPGEFNRSYQPGDTSETTFRLRGGSAEGAIVFSSVSGYHSPRIEFLSIDDYTDPDYAGDLNDPDIHVAALYVPVFAAPDADSDGDGAPDLLDWASGLHHDQPDAKVLTPVPQSPPATFIPDKGLPHIALIPASGERRLRIEFVRIAGDLAHGTIRYIPEFSSDLRIWEPAESVSTLLPIDAVWERAVATDPEPLGPGTPKRYGRLRIEYNPPPGE